MRCVCLCQGMTAFPPVGSPAPHRALGHGEVPEGLGSIGISFSLSGSHKLRHGPTLPVSTTLAAMTVQLFTDLYLEWGS